jgi:CHAT domain
MQRVVIEAVPAADAGADARVEGAAGWIVSARTVDPDTGAELDIVPPYPMSAAAIEGRWVPRTPPERAPTATQAHAGLATGSADEIGELLGRLATRTTRDDDVARYGRWLFECLLAPAWAEIRSLPNVRRGRSVELALLWDVESDLHRLVWESMRDGTAALAGHPELLVAISRLVPAPVPDVATITGLPTVLFVAGSRLTDPVIRPGAMFMGLLRSLDANGQCQARAIQAATINDLADECARWRPDVVHLVAHGVVLPNGRTALMMRDDTGQREADAEALVTALSAGGLPTAVALSACSTATPTDTSPLAAQLVSAGIPMVSAMAGEVSELACRLYTRRLATAVHDGLPVVEASAAGRRAALTSTPEPTAEIDWALPALFLAQTLDPLQQLVDSRQSRRLVGLANNLSLRQEPVFIGREAIMAAADHLVVPEHGVGVVAVLAEGTTSGLGGTRLLREIGWRLLRAGHVPLLLGPYSERSAPSLARELVARILERAILAAESMDLAPSVPLTLQLEEDVHDPLEPKIAGLRVELARVTIRRALAAFRQRDGEIDPDTARNLVGADLADLARHASAWGPPFGNHSQAVLLCDNVHWWWAAAAPGVGPVSALDCLLRMIGPDGLGRSARNRVPVVLTGSRTMGGGAALSTWSRGAQPWLRAPQLGDLDRQEALLGYQWVLLHPWTSSPDQDLFGRVYTARPGRVADWEGGLGRVPLTPSSVASDLYPRVDTLFGAGVGQRDNDEETWRSYADAQQGLASAGSA